MLIEKDAKRQALFWSKVQIASDEDSCWSWMGARNEKGYGIITVTIEGRQKFFYAHRVSWSWEYGDIPENLIIRHKCDNPSCVRPSHLIVGTHQDNTNDKMERGRYVSAVAEITPQDAFDIRVAKSLGVSTEQLSSRYDLCSQHINAICRGVYWPDAGGPITSRFEIPDEVICAVMVDLETLSRQQCAEKHGISLASVHKIAQGHRQPQFPLFFYQ